MKNQCFPPCEELFFCSDACRYYSNTVPPFEGEGNSIAGCRAYWKRQKAAFRNMAETPPFSIEFFTFTINSRFGVLF